MDSFHFCWPDIRGVVQGTVHRPYLLLNSGAQFTGEELEGPDVPKYLKSGDKMARYLPMLQGNTEVCRIKALIISLFFPLEKKLNNSLEIPWNVGLLPCLYNATHAYNLGFAVWFHFWL